MWTQHISVVINFTTPNIYYSKFGYFHDGYLVYVDFNTKGSDITISNIYHCIYYNGVTFKSTVVKTGPMQLTFQLIPREVYINGRGGQVNLSYSAYDSEGELFGMNFSPNSIDVIKSTYTYIEVTEVGIKS